MSDQTNPDPTPTNPENAPVAKPATTYRLGSASMIHGPGMVRNWQQQARIGGEERMRAAVTCGLCYASLPFCAVLDLVDGRIRGRVEGKPGEEAYVFEWDEPLGDIGEMLDLRYVVAVENENAALPAVSRPMRHKEAEAFVETFRERVRAQEGGAYAVPYDGARIAADDLELSVREVKEHTEAHAEAIAERDEAAASAGFSR